MSVGVDIPLATAREAAETLRALLADECDRIEIAGSIRRRKPTVHDIEIVAIPRVVERQIVQGFFEDLGTVVDQQNLLEERLAVLVDSGTITRRRVENHRADGSVEIQEKWGPSFKAATFEGMPVDLFITDAERWGCIFALRTGPGDWNTRLVTECKRVNRAVAGGRVLHLGKPVPTLEEEDFFRELGQPWLDPWERRVDRVAIAWPVPT